eukprot:CAMPEP_0170480128 /NCGR_PEP_ID=MMETSP0208-20121228/1085_1 /TAXON_ID=197538 /ORGANISM="Strombidium inclinatum, Strain S3" /LENGTH=162 /DNA_ID=CAMNT_0010752617 /DNA_START=702 /DNA_END=1190 /DNA_ORIENTATION=-
MGAALFKTAPLLVQNRSFLLQVSVILIYCFHQRRQGDPPEEETVAEVDHGLADIFDLHHRPHLEDPYRYQKEREGGQNEHVQSKSILDREDPPADYGCRDRNSKEQKHQEAANRRPVEAVLPPVVSVAFFATEHVPFVERFRRFIEPLGEGVVRVGFGRALD